MITQLNINNFKFHKNTELKIGNLTIICGNNSVGKTSAIQPLLLLREAYLNKSEFSYLDLLSNPVKVGTVGDALYQYGNKDMISFELKTNYNDYQFSFGEETSDYTKTLIEKSIDSELNNFENIFNGNESLFSENFQYISSARIGSLQSYPKDDVVVEKYKQISVIEGKAEFCVHFLHRNQNQEVIAPLINKNSELTNLISQVTAWEKDISEGIIVKIEDNGKLGFELKYQYDTLIGTKKSNELSAQNVGFGITYVLPILVAILSAKPNSLIIIENPEAHLHPYGIAKITELICKAAQAGIQIIIETHSDHVINGILVQSKKFTETEGKEGINSKNVKIYQFVRNNEEFCAKVELLNIEEDGRIRYAPKGFFDQFSIDRKYLIGF